MNIDKLVTMANQMGDFFQTLADPQEAQDGLTTHLRKFWTPTMRQCLMQALDQPSTQALNPWVRAVLSAAEKEV